MPVGQGLDRVARLGGIVAAHVVQHGDKLRFIGAEQVAGIQIKRIIGAEIAASRGNAQPLDMLELLAATK